MQEEVLQISDMKRLKRNEKLRAGCSYILSSESVGSNLYFETKRDILRAHRLMNTHLIPIMDIIDYLFTPHGWVLVVAIKETEEIIQGIDRTRYQSKKMKRAIRKREISAIISECMRYTISGIARIVNRNNDRLGTLVRCNFKRFIFECIESAELFMAGMKRQQLKLCCQRKRYRSNLKWYDQRAEFQKVGDVFLCSMRRGSVGLSEGTEAKCLNFVYKKIYVLQEKIMRTLDTHFPNKSPNSTNFSPSRT